MANIAVTGASGFIGDRLIRSLNARGESVIAVSRQPSAVPAARRVVVEDYADVAGMAVALRGVDALIHLAARAHQGSVGAGDVDLFHAANVQTTLNVARACLAAEVKRYVFVSSIGVNGICSRRPFTEKDVPAPTEPYAVSKWEAERGLWSLVTGTSMECVILRPPLVYGPSCPGNFAKLARLVSRLPLVPMGDLKAERSFVGVDNLCDALWVAATHPNCRRATFVVADEQTTNVAELAEIVLQVAGRGTWRLQSIPRPALTGVFRMVGRGDEFAKLSSELVVDPSLFRQITGWRATKTCRAGMEEAAASLVGSLHPLA